MNTLNDNLHNTANYLIEIDNLSLGFIGKDKQQRPILRNLSLTIAAGETLGIVGESGSGKSTVALAMMGFLKSGLQVFGGRVVFNGHELFAISAKARRNLRGGDIALIPQNAGQSLTPTIKIGKQIDEALCLHTDLDKTARQSKVIELLSRVRLPAPEAIAARYPHELSGGQQQRVAIAMALGTGAKSYYSTSRPRAWTSQPKPIFWNFYANSRAKPAWR